MRVVNLHTGPAAPYEKDWVLTYLPEFVRRVRCFAEGEDLSYDLIHSHYWLSGEAALRLRRSWGVPVVHMCHTLGAMKNSVARSAEETETNQRIAIERRYCLLQKCRGEIFDFRWREPLEQSHEAWELGRPERIPAVIALIIPDDVGAVGESHADNSMRTVPGTCSRPLCSRGRCCLRSPHRGDV